MEIPRHWRLKNQRYKLVGEVCPHCEAKLFPPRDVCPECGGEAKTLYTFSGRGEVYSFTTVFDAPAGYEENAPYMVALMTDLGDLPVAIGTPVEMVTRRLKSDGDERGMVVYGYKFRPVLARAN